MLTRLSDFFEPPPPRRMPSRWPRHPPWYDPPPSTLPTMVPVERVLARTQEVVVCVTRLAAYPTGFELEVVTMSGSPYHDHGLYSLDPFGVMRALDEDMRALDEGEDGPRSGAAGGEWIPELRVGVQFPDGSKATNLHGYNVPDASAPGLVMKKSGGRGGSSGGDWRETYWVWPLPMPGPLFLVCEWPALGIPLTRSEIQAEAIIEAASRAQVIFSDEDHPEWPPKWAVPASDMP